MNYTRRPNRPDGNHYREMRRRGLRGSSSLSSSRSRGRRTGVGGVVVLIVICASVVGWMLLR